MLMVGGLVLGALISTSSATGAPSGEPLADPFVADATEVAARVVQEPQDLRNPFERDRDQLPANKRKRLVSNAASAGLRDPFRAKRQNSRLTPKPEDLRSPFDGTRSQRLVPAPATKQSSDPNLRDPFAI
ncbi:MAG: hypothetical protein AAF799_12975 [Myxococcota bacterium]